jgi:hypothetical protein
MGDASYFKHRALEQSEAAAKAQHPNARKAHLELSRRYQEFAEAILAQQRRYGVCGSDDSMAV